MAFGLALSALALSGCSDTWDDHYDVPQGGEGVSLWQAISNDSELSNFASVVRATGYDKILDGSQVLTVFAPTNAQFSEAEAQELIDQYNNNPHEGSTEDNNRTIKEFVRNHIALYNRSVVEGRTDTIRLLNGKYADLSSQTIGGATLLTANKLYGNGMLYKLDRPAHYTPNVFEAIEKTEGLDSVAAFFNAYSKYFFDARQSVPGNINEEGQTEYLDSVKVLQNEMMYAYGRLDREDSTYWMAAPNNEEWTRLVEEYSQFFNYNVNVDKADSMMWTNPRRYLLEGCTFNKTENHQWESFADSAWSTNANQWQLRKLAYGYDDIAFGVYEKPYAAGGILDPAAVASTVECSNGRLYAMSKWNFDPKLSFMKRILLEGEKTSQVDEESFDEKKTLRPEGVDIPNSSAFYDSVSNHRCVRIAPAGSTNQSVTYKLSDQLSNVPYDVYVQFVPAVAIDSLATPDQRLGTKLRITLSCENQSGKMVEVAKNSSLETIPDQIDRHLVASGVVFPVCSAEANRSQVQMLIECRVSNSELTKKKFNRNILIDCIVLVPHLPSETANQ